VAESSFGAKKREGQIICGPLPDLVQAERGRRAEISLEASSRDADGVPIGGPEDSSSELRGK